MTVLDLQVDPFAGIGGSEVGAILGVSPFATPLDIWRRKVLRQPDDDEPLSAAGAGKRFETAILAAYAASLPGGSRVWVPPRSLKGWRRDSPDSLAEVGGWTRVVDAKSTIMPEYGADGSDEVPLYVAAQVMWYMDLRGIDEADVPVLQWPHRSEMRNVMGLTPEQIVAALGIQVMHVPFSPSMAALARESADRFWHEHVLPVVPPPPANLEDAKRMVWAVRGKTVPVTEAMAQRLLRRDELKAQMKDLQASLEECEFRIRSEIGDAEAVVDLAGNALATCAVTERAGYSVKPTTFRSLKTTKTWKEMQKL